MKILHVSPSYVPAYRYGGPVKATHELCRELARKGVDVTVFTTNLDGEKNLDVPLNTIQEIEGVKVIYHPVRFMRWYCYSKDLYDSLKNNISGFDCVHINSIYLYPTLVAAHWCRKCKIPYIIEPFGALDPAMIALKGELKKKLYINLIERRNVNGASAVHVTSLYEKNNLMSLGFNAPITVVPRGINIKEYSADGAISNLRQRYPQLEGKKVILFLGRIHFKKGLDLLASTFKKITQRRKDVYLVIAGPDEDGYADEVKKMFIRLGLGEHTIFTGMLLGQDKLSALYSSDVFVLPSYGENLGNAVLEAMACSLPVVITNRVGLYTYIEEYKTGIVTGCNSETITSAILRLLNEEALRRTMGKNARTLIEEQFNLDKIVDEMIQMYEHIINQKR